VNPKVQFGCGDQRLSGWENTDIPAVDITKPLPYADNSVRAVFASHVVEHIEHQQAWNFFDECYRVLEPSGVIRITVPSFTRISRGIDDEYREFVRSRGWSNGSKKDTLRSMVFEHGHKAMWTADLLIAFLDAIGFHNPMRQESGISNFTELSGLESHASVIGIHADNIESVSVEGQKCST